MKYVQSIHKIHTYIVHTGYSWNTYVHSNYRVIIKVCTLYNVLSKLNRQNVKTNKTNRIYWKQIDNICVLQIEQGENKQNDL